jgi:hypothetical protein
MMDLHMCSVETVEVFANGGDMVAEDDFICAWSRLFRFLQMKVTLLLKMDVLVVLIELPQQG